MSMLRRGSAALLAALLVPGAATAALGAESEQTSSPESEVIIEPAPAVEEMDLSQYSEEEVDSILRVEAGWRVGLTEEDFQTLDWVNLEEVQDAYADLRDEYDATGTVAPSSGYATGSDVSDAAACSFYNDLLHVKTRGTASGYESYTYIPGTSDCNDINLSFVTEKGLYRVVHQAFGYWRAGNEGWQRVTAVGDQSPWRVLHLDKNTGKNHRGSSGNHGSTAHHRT